MNELQRIIVDLFDWGNSMPTGIIAYPDISNDKKDVLSEYCDSVKDFTDFLDMYADRIDVCTELQFIVNGAEIEFCKDAIKTIQEHFDNIVSSGNSKDTDEYVVSVAVDGRVDVKVKAKSFTEAKEKASMAVCDADFGELECIDWKCVNAERNDGEFMDY